MIKEYLTQIANYPNISIILFLFIFSNLLFISLKKSRNYMEFALNNKNIKTLPLFFTIIATNLSAFTIFGVTGASYKYGFAFFPIMGFGTAFMTISFIIIGIPLRKIALENNYISVSEIIQKRSSSNLLALIFSLLTLYFTLPYISTQIFSAGKLISSATGLSYKLSSFIFVVIITSYIVFGGMKSIIKTDIFQFIVLLIFCLIFFFIGFNLISKSKFSLLSENFIYLNRNGIDNSITPIKLLSYYILWFLADPMFPHINHRFIGSKSDSSLIKSMILYPFALLIVFLSMNFIGVYGRIIYPNLQPGEYDNIIKIIINNNFIFLQPLFYLASIAAIMSTLDSQILSCSIIIVNDLIKTNKIKIFKYLSNKKNRKIKEENLNLDNTKIIISKFIIIILSSIAYLISLNPPASILNFLTSSSFAGYSILFPIVFCIIYFPFLNKNILIINIITMFIILTLQSSKILSIPIPQVIFNLILQIILIILGFLFQVLFENYKSKKVNNSEKVKFKKINFEFTKNKYLNRKTILIMILIFILGFDLFNYFIKPFSLYGIPIWVYYHIIILIITGFLFYVIYKINFKNIKKEMFED
ncbi:MAG: sodium:solute symporter family protein [Spirochaetes bacterium]|nr:sodium:solute symporter family protein [Spirochaetota bacterium]